MWKISLARILGLRSKKTILMCTKCITKTDWLSPIWISRRKKTRPGTNPPSRTIITYLWSCWTSLSKVPTQRWTRWVPCGPRHLPSRSSSQVSSYLTLCSNLRPRSSIRIRSVTISNDWTLATTCLTRASSSCNKSWKNCISASALSTCTSCLIKLKISTTLLWVSKLRWTKWGKQMRS